MTATALSTRQLLARHMRVLRAARAWSQEALAEAAGVHRTYISGIEQMKYNVGIDSLEKIAASVACAMRTNGYRLRVRSYDACNPSKHADTDSAAVNRLTA